MILKQKQWPVLFTAFLCITFINVTAQAKKLKDSTPEQRAKMLTEWMTNKLSLKSRQVEQVSVLNLQYARKNDPVLQSDEGTLAKFKKLKTLEKEKSEALKQILDAEQYKKYQEIKHQIIQNIKNKRK